MKIKTIKKVDTETVYDIQVEDVHHYILENGTITHNSGLKYAASTIAMLSKSKDKDEKTKEVVGNIIKCKMYKNRIAKENTEVEVKLSYKTGLDRYYGLLDLAVKHDIFKKSTKGIGMPDGSFTASKNVENEPEKFFTKDILEKLDKAAKKEFSYGT